MKQRLFGTSGIRGIINSDYYADLPLKVGLAIATLTNSGDILTGRDSRVSSSMFEESLISGLLAGGSSVQCLGLVPTPVLAFLTRELDAETGVMITASHNPPEYNGIKLFCKDSCAYADDQQVQIEEIIRNQSFRRVCASTWKTLIDARKINEVNSYFEIIRNKIKLNKKWRIVLDLGHGATCCIAPKLFREKNLEVITINSHIDGFFPGRKPLPDAESLIPLFNVVKNLSADIGIAYDGDGDRMSIIDEKGSMIPSDQLMAAFAAHRFKKNDGGIVVTTVEASLCMESMVEEYSGKVIRTNVGDVAIATSTKKHRAIFGGEPCVAWYFRWRTLWSLDKSSISFMSRWNSILPSSSRILRGVSHAFVFLDF
jgi:phosphoglucosamine mutase